MDLFAKAPEEGAFCFSWKLPFNISHNGKSRNLKGEFFMNYIITFTSFLKKERGDAHEEIKKQIIGYGNKYDNVQGNV